VAAWRVSRRGGWAAQGAALSLFLVQLAVNFAWSPLFFSLQQIGGALIDIVALRLLIMATIFMFARIDRLAAVLLVPYLAWVSYATALNWAFYSAN
jgi:benzodiazapine receptor